MHEPPDPFGDDCSWLRAQRRILPTGATVIAHRAPYPVAAIATAHQVGFRDEDDTSAGFAHLIEHLVSRRVAHDPVWRALTTGNAAWLAESRRDYTVFALAGPAETLPQLLQAEAHRLADLSIAARDVPIEARVIQAEYDTLIEARGYGPFPGFLCTRHLFDTLAEAGDGYGPLKHLRATDPAGLTAFLHTHYTSARTIVAVVSDLAEDRVLDLLCNALEPFRRDGRVRAPAPEPSPLPTRRLVRYTRPAVPDALAMAWRIPDPGWDYAAYVAAVTAWRSLGAVDGPLSAWLRARGPHLCARTTIGTYDAPWDLRTAAALILELSGDAISVLRTAADALRAELPELAGQTTGPLLRRTAGRLQLDLASLLDDPLRRARQIAAVAAMFDGRHTLTDLWSALAHQDGGAQALRDILAAPGCLTVECAP